MTDIHCHILFGLDDGAEDLKTSRRMLAAASAMGVDHIVATPHVRHLPFDFELAYRNFGVVSRIAEQRGMGFDLGFEVHWNALLGFDEHTFEDICFLGSNDMLLEFSLSSNELPQGHDQMIYRLQRCGIHVIIAHPERYRFVQTDTTLMDRWHDMGCSLQLDANCLLHGREGFLCRYTARKLLKTGVYDYVASDAHGPEDYKLFEKALVWAEKHS